MAAEFEAYVRRGTWLYALDPRVKLAFVAEGTLLAFLWPRVEVAAAIAAACVVLLLSARVPPARIGRFLRGILPLLVMVLLLTALFAAGEGPAWVHWGPIRISAAGAWQGLLLAARLLALALVFFFWLTTTDQAGMVRGFMALRLPYAWGLTLALTLRYLPILAGLFEQVREAQEARGLDLAQGGMWRRLGAYRPVLVAVVIGALRYSERLGWALESRALGVPGVRRSIYRPLRLRGPDVAALALLAIVLAGALMLRVS